MALAYQREYPLAAASLGCFLSPGCVVPGASSAAHGRGARRKVHLDPAAAAVAIWISPGAIGRVVFVHVSAGVFAYLRLFEIYRTPVARELDAGGAPGVGADLYKLFWMGSAGIVRHRPFIAIWAGEANVAAAAGDGDIPDCGVYSDHARVPDGTSYRCCNRPCDFTGCYRYLQSLLFICERIGGAVVLGARDCGGIGDCLRVAFRVRLRQAGGSAIFFVFRGAAGGDDDLANCHHPAFADDQPVADSFHRDHARDDGVAVRATVPWGRADFSCCDWLVRNFLAQTLRRAALDRALGSSGAAGGGSCRQRRDRDWQQSFILFLPDVSDAIREPRDERLFCGAVAFVRAGARRVRPVSVASRGRTYQANRGGFRRTELRSAGAFDG